MCRNQLIRVCYNLEIAIQNQLNLYGYKLKATDKINYNTESNKNIVAYLYNLSIISQHPELYYLRK